MEIVTLSEALKDKAFRSILAHNNLYKRLDNLVFKKGVVNGETRYSMTIKSNP